MIARIILMLGAALLLCGGSGCAAYRPLQLMPVKASTPVAPKFSESFYHYDRDRNLFFVMRSNTTDPVTGQPVEQIATIRMFWHPHGGVTTLNPSAVNATIRYVVMTPDAVGMYEGAGFVRPLSKVGRNRFNARLMDADLRLTASSARFVDNLGRVRMSGYFSAAFDDARSLDGLLGAHREFFARSLESKPAETNPATTTPATTPTANGSQ